MQPVLSSQYYCDNLALYKMTKTKKKVAYTKQKKNNKFFITLLLSIFGLILAIIGIFGFSYLKSLVIPIIVEPSEVAIQQYPWSTKNIFNISNLRQDKTQFDIWIMLKFENCALTPQNISIDLPDLQNTLAERMSQIEVSYDCVIIKGVDSQDNLIAFLIIHHLLPSQSLPITINVNPPDAASVSNNARISIKPVRQSDTPISLNNNGSELSYPFTPPINFKAKTIALKLRKTQ